MAAVLGMLAAPRDGPASSTTSLASGDSLGDAPGHAPAWTDGASDKRRSRASDDGRSDTSSRRRRMSALFKTRKKATSPYQHEHEHEHEREREHEHEGPPPPVLPHVGAAPGNGSEESLALYKSTPSSLLADSDSEA